MTIYCIGVLWIAIITQLVINRAFQDDDRIIQAFAATDSQAVEGRLSLVVDYGIRYMSQEDKENLIDHLAGTVGLEKTYEIKKVEGDTTVSVSAEKAAKNSNTKFEVVSVSSEDKEKHSETKQYIMATISVYNNMDSVLQYKEILEKAVKKMDITSCETSLEFIGTYNGKLSLGEQSKVTDSLIEELQGKIINQNRSEELFTVYAYTGVMDDYLTVEGKRVNVNVAITYDENNDQTKLYLATPIINEDY